MKKEFDLTKGSIPNVLTAFIVPMILGSLIQQLYTTAGATILISGYYGAKDEKSLRCCVRTANTLALVLGVICAIAGILRSFGDSRRPLAALIFSSVVNIIGDYLLVGIFRMGVQGAAIATIAAWGICDKMNLLIWLIADAMSPALIAAGLAFTGMYVWKQRRLGKVIQ